MPELSPESVRPEEPPPKVLVEYFLLEAKRLEAGELTQRWRYRDYLRQLVGHFAERLSSGNLEAPKAFLGECATLRAHLRQRREKYREPAEAALEDARHMMQLVEWIDVTLERRRFENELLDQPPEGFRYWVLQALSRTRGKFLTRGELREEIPERERRTPARMSQLLAEFLQEGLVLRRIAPGRGRGNVSHYALSSRGTAYCDRWAGRAAAKPEVLWREIEGWQAAFARAAGRERGGGIITVASLRTGSGGSTLLANLAIAAARVSSHSVLVIDFTNEGAARLLGMGSAATAGDIGSLYRAYRQVTESERGEWLCRALDDSRWLATPRNVLRNLYLLHLPNEDGESMTRIREESSRQPGAATNSPFTAQSGFLGHLRAAVKQQFTTVLVDAGSRLDVTSYLGVIQIADEVVLCARSADPWPAPLLRVVSTVVHRETPGRDGPTIPYLVFAQQPPDSTVPFHDVRRTLDVDYPREAISSVPFDPISARGERTQWYPLAGGQSLEAIRALLADLNGAPRTWQQRGVRGSGITAQETAPDSERVLVLSR